MNMVSFHFVPLSEEHCTTIFEWLKQPHISAFWQDPADFEKFKHKYLIEKPSRFVFGHVAFMNGKAMAYIQHYSAKKVGGGWWPVATDSTYGIDVMIGDVKNTSQGLGADLVSQYLQQMGTKFKGELKSIEWIADPDESNLKAIRCFEKVGFKNHGKVPTPYGEAIYMTLLQNV